MVNMRQHLVSILTPKGTVFVTRRLYERLEAKMQPDDWGLLRDVEFWDQLSELVEGIRVERAPVQKGEGAA